MLTAVFDFFRRSLRSVPIFGSNSKKQLWRQPQSCPYLKLGNYVARSLAGCGRLFIRLSTEKRRDKGHISTRPELLYTSYPNEKKVYSSLIHTKGLSLPFRLSGPGFSLRDDAFSWWGEGERSARHDLLPGTPSLFILVTRLCDFVKCCRFRFFL